MAYEKQRNAEWFCGLDKSKVIKLFHCNNGLIKILKGLGENPWWGVGVSLLISLGRISPLEWKTVEKQNLDIYVLTPAYFTKLQHLLWKPKIQFYTEDIFQNINPFGVLR